MPEPTAPKLKNYKILSRLSSGGMGAVYEAEDLKLRRRVAIKALEPEWAADPERLMRFRREARVLATLNHPSIVTVHAIEEEAGGQFLVMELIEGQTLAEIIPSVGMQTERILQIAIPLADALAVAHEQGIVHRDLKPANIMVGNGRVKILDYGLAKQESDGAAGGARTDLLSTRDGQMLGTVPYMSPEQVQGEEVDHRTDIFSLGVILYEMATGRRPFEGASWADLASSILRDNPPSVSTLNLYLPRHLGRIIRHCLEKDPRRRFQTALDLRNELEGLQRELLSGELSVSRAEVAAALAQERAAREPPAGELADRASSSSVELEVPPPRRDLERPLAVVATVLLAAVMASLLWLRADRAAGPPAVAPAPAAAAAVSLPRIVVLPLENLGPEEQAYFSAGMTEELTSRLASVSALQVISRTTALNYDRTDKTAQEIGADLGVHYLLEGTVRWSTTEEDENRVRVTPQLIRVADDTQVWSASYERVVDDLFAVQEEIAREVIRQLDIALLEPERAALASNPTDDLEAYRAYVLGREYAGRRDPSPENWQQVVELFERAVTLDPEFALAWAELSETHSLMYHWVIDRTPERLEQARAAAERALAIQPSLAEGHRALGFYHYRGHRDYEAALEAFDVAAESLPNDSQLLAGIGYIRRRQGLFATAVVSLEKALEIEPRSDWLAVELADTYRTMRLYESADRFYRRAIELAPDQPQPYQGQARNFLLWRGDLEAARAALEAMPRQEETASLLAWYDLEVAARREQAALGRLRRIRVELIGVESASYPKDLLRALVYRRLGRDRLARDAFENARLMLERRLPQDDESGDPRLRITLAMTYAGLGRKAEAIREGELAVARYPVSRDALIGPRFVEHLAHVYAMVGERDAALERLEYLLSIPSDLSAPVLRLDPRWDPLRAERRFAKLVGG